MPLKLTVPAADAAYRAGFVSKWHIAEGDPIGFGDDLCDIGIDEFMALQRTKRASLLGSTSKRRKRRVTDAYDRREGRGLVHIRLTSSEAGLTLGKILVPEGGRIEIGTVVAVLTTGDDDPIVEGDLSAARDARIVVNHPDAQDVEPF